MTSEHRRELIRYLYDEQVGLCAYCEQPLGPWIAGGHPVELAHKVPRGRLVRMCGKGAEWHPLALALVCTRYGKRCNDGVLLPIGLPREDLMQRIREEI